MGRSLMDGATELRPKHVDSGIHRRGRHSGVIVVGGNDTSRWRVSASLSRYLLGRWRPSCLKQQHRADCAP